MQTRMGSTRFRAFRATADRRCISLGSALACSLLLTAAAAHAGSVAGTATYDAGRLKPPARNQGFVPRIENPLRPVKKPDPLPWLVVVLEGGPAAEDAGAPPEKPVRYALLGESFATPILPVVAGSRVELVNRGYRTPVLLTPDFPDLVDAVALAPRAKHTFTTGEPLRPVIIRAERAPHLQGKVLPLPHRYFAAVDDRGRFAIDDVPAGEWKVRVWYRDGWLQGVAETVQVGTKRTTITLKIPPKLELEPPAGSQ